MIFYNNSFPLFLLFSFFFKKKDLDILITCILSSFFFFQVRSALNKAAHQTLDGNFEQASQATS